MRPRFVTPAWVRHAAALVLLTLGLMLVLTACGRIPQSEAERLSGSGPTATVSSGGGQASGGTPASGGGGGAPSGGAPGGFKPAEMPTGSVASGQTVYVSACQNCHGAGGKAGEANQAALVGPKGLIATRNLDTADKFSAAFNANPIHADIKDNTAFVNPQRLINMYAYLVSQFG